MNHQKKIEESKMDEQLSGLFTSYGGEKAPADFTEKLMLRLEQEKESTFIYKPVISKVAWMVIGMIVAAILLAAVFLFPASGYTPAVMQKLTGIFSFQFLDGSLFHFENRLLQSLSGSHVLLSVLAITIVIGWQYLFMYGRRTGKRKGISGMLLF